MKFSFIIPIFNCGEYINKVICEIEEVKLYDYEIILVDDGSTDGSGYICDINANENEKIKCIHQKNAGVSAARNKGLQLATGEYVLFFDSDDSIESKKLYYLLKKMEKLEDVDMAIFSMSFDYYRNGALYYRNEISMPFYGIQESTVWASNINELYYTNAISPIWNKVFRRSFLINNALYFQENMFLYEDLEYSIRCMSHCNQIMFDPEIIYHYRQTEDEGNVGRRLMKIEHIFILIDEIENALDKLLEAKNLKMEQENIKSILSMIYITLAREKIAIVDIEQVKQICVDFIYWYQSKGIKIDLENQKYAKLLLKKNVKRLILNRNYIKLRHRMAVIVKGTKIYHKLRG